MEDVFVFVPDFYYIATRKSGQWQVQAVVRRRLSEAIRCRGSRVRQRARRVAGGPQVWADVFAGSNLGCSGRARS